MNETKTIEYIKTTVNLLLKAHNYRIDGGRNSYYSISHKIIFQGFLVVFQKVNWVEAIYYLTNEQ